MLNLHKAGIAIEETLAYLGVTTIVGSNRLRAWLAGGWCVISMCMYIEVKSKR